MPESECVGQRPGREPCSGSNAVLVTYKPENADPRGEAAK
jgi:hypothetical protein